MYLSHVSVKLDQSSLGFPERKKERKKKHKVLTPFVAIIAIIAIYEYVRKKKKLARTLGIQNGNLR